MRARPGHTGQALDRSFQRPEHGDNGAPPSVDARVASEQVRQLYGQGTFVLLANVVNAAIVAIALWHTVAHVLLLAWAAAMSAMAIVRWRLRHAYMAKPRGPEETKLWSRRAVMGSCVAGTLWGAAGAVCPIDGSVVAQLVVVFVLGGMGASAAGTISCYLPAFYAYFLPSMLPLVVKLAWLGDRSHLSLSAMAALFVLLMSGVARNISRAMVTSFRLRFANHDLVEELAGAKRDLLQVNADLERRVAERTVQIARQADDRARLERDLQGARRMEAIGRLAGGVAHEFNNALSVVIAGIESLRDPLHANERQAVLRDMEDSARAATESASRLMAFSRGRPDQKGQCEPHRVLERFASGVRRMLPEDVVVEVQASEAGFIELPPSHLEQVLLNLVLNARDAMPKGGVIQLRARAEKELVVIEVADQGEGMDEATRLRAFDPYFTTKGESSSGLGLAAVWGLVTGAGGMVEIDSQPGTGSLFRLTFPRTQETVSSAPEVEATPTPSRPRRILVLEDEGGVRRVIERLLRGEGYQVSSHETADTAREALLAESFDCLVTDSIVPGGGVSELVKEFVKTNVSAPVVVCSGHVGEQVLLDGINSDAYTFIAKPFAPSALLKMVAHVMARAQTS